MWYRRRRYHLWLVPLTCCNLSQLSTAKSPCVRSTTTTYSFSAVVFVSVNVLFILQLRERGTVCHLTRRKQILLKRSKNDERLSCSANIMATFNYFYRFIFLCKQLVGLCCKLPCRPVMITTRVHSATNRVATSVNVNLWDLRSSKTVFIRVIRGQPGGLFHSSSGDAVEIFLVVVHSCSGSKQRKTPCMYCHLASEMN